MINDQIRLDFGIDEIEYFLDRFLIKINILISDNRFDNDNKLIMIDRFYLLIR